MFGRWIVVGNGSLPLPLVYVDDVVQAMVLAATRPLTPGTLVNLVDPATINQRDFIAMVQADRPGLKATYTPKPVLMTLALGVEALGRMLKRGVPLSRYRIASIRPLAWFDQTAARQLLGWTPQVGLQEGLRRTYGVRSTTPPSGSL
jgi:nucleoside-diphosphate-sugar epimerase